MLWFCFGTDRRTVYPHFGGRFIFTMKTWKLYLSSKPEKRWKKTECVHLKRVSSCEEQKIIIREYIACNFSL